MDTLELNIQKDGLNANNARSQLGKTTRLYMLILPYYLSGDDPPVLLENEQRVYHRTRVCIYIYIIITCIYIYIYYAYVQK